MKRPRHFCFARNKAAGSGEVGAEKKEPIVDWIMNWIGGSETELELCFWR